MSVHGRGVSYFLGEENGIFRNWGRYWRRGSLRVALFWVCLQALLGSIDNPTSPFPWVLGFRRSGYFHSPGLQHPHCNPHVGSEMPHSWWPRSFLLVLLLLMPVPTLVKFFQKPTGPFPGSCIEAAVSFSSWDWILSLFPGEVLAGLATVPLASLSSDVSLAVAQIPPGLFLLTVAFPTHLPIQALCYFLFPAFLSEFCSTQHPQTPLPMPVGASALCSDPWASHFGLGLAGSTASITTPGSRGLVMPWESSPGLCGDRTQGKQEWLQLLFPS